MLQKPVIRPVARGDHAQWLRLWEGYNLFYERVGPAAIPPAVTRTTWDRFLDADEPVHALVACRDGTLLGLAHYLFHRSTWALAPSCCLEDLFTAPAARGQGVGRALIEGVYAQARRAGSPQVYWQTHETNRTAMRLYDAIGERSGFVVYRTAL